MRVHGMMKGNEFIFQWSGSDYLARVHCIGQGQLKSPYSETKIMG
jgi:hypothetical protein